MLIHNTTIGMFNAPDNVRLAPHAAICEGKIGIRKRKRGEALCHGAEGQGEIAVRLVQFHAQPLGIHPHGIDANAVCELYRSRV